MGKKKKAPLPPPPPPAVEGGDTIGEEPELFTSPRSAADFFSRGSTGERDVLISAHAAVQAPLTLVREASKELVRRVSAAPGASPLLLQLELLCRGQP